MGLFDRFRTELPEVPVSDQLRSQIGNYCNRLPVPSSPEKVAKAVDLSCDVLLAVGSVEGASLAIREAYAARFGDHFDGLSFFSSFSSIC